MAGRLHRYSGPISASLARHGSVALPHRSADLRGVESEPAGRGANSEQ